MNNCQFADASISAFQGNVKISEGSHSINILPAPDNERLECIAWCLQYLACVGAVVPKDGGTNCRYVTSTSGEQVTNLTVNLYVISRVCIPRAKRE